MGDKINFLRPSHILLKDVHFVYWLLLNSCVSLPKKGLEIHTGGIEQIETMKTQ